ncbi:MAG: hypothetical protein AAFY02_09560 [Pseudomonadota bacterium]
MHHRSPTWRRARRRFLGLSALCLLPLVAPPAQAEREILGEELVKLLKGRTAIGTWNGRSYAQFFGDSGRTAYQEEGAPIDWGSWHIADTGRFCSIWPRGGEGCYRVYKDGDRYLWEAANGGPRHPFVVEDGNKVLGN